MYEYCDGYDIKANKRDTNARLLQESITCDGIIVCKLDGGGGGGGRG